MTNEERKEFYMNRNIKLSPSFIALTWDVIFIWTISTLYFTTQKGLSNSQVISLDSILMLAGCIFCIPVAKMFQNITPIKATRISLFGYAGYILLCIFGTSFITFVIAQLFLAFGYAINAIKTNSVLTDSLEVVKRDKDYQRIYGKGLSLLYIIEFVGAIGITYVYNWIPVMAYWFSFAVVVLAFGLSYFFKEPSKFQDKNVQISSIETTKKSTQPDSYFKILASAFLISMLVYAFLLRGVLSISGSALKIYLNELVSNRTIPIWAYGYLYAGSRLCAALSCKYQFKFNLKFGVRSLILFNAATIFSFLIAGLAYIINPSSIISIVIIIIVSYIQCSLRMPNQIFLNNYLQVCTDKKNIERAYSIRTMVEYLGYAVISALYAMLLNNFNDNYGLTSLTYIGILAVPLVVSFAVFLRFLIKKYTNKKTIIKKEYTED